MTGLSAAIDAHGDAVRVIATAIILFSGAAVLCLTLWDRFFRKAR